MQGIQSRQFFLPNFQARSRTWEVLLVLAETLINSLCGLSYPKYGVSLLLLVPCCCRGVVLALRVEEKGIKTSCSDASTSTKALCC